MSRGILLFPMIILLASLTLAVADPARAIATVFKGLVSGITVTHPGAGYTMAPSVRITGGNGSGASAAASVESGAVIQIVITSAGSNYTAVPVVEVDPPASMEIDLVARLTVRGTSASVHEIQWAESLGDQAVWTHLTNMTLLTAQAQVVDLATPAHGYRYYRRVDHFPGMVFISPGTFLMGSPLNEALRDSDETQHWVTLSSGFWMRQHEVTQAEYETVKGSNPSYFKGALLPVETVSWFDATDYCVRLTQREASAGRLPQGYVYRLPTEAEWEYACRAGTTTAFHYGTSLLSGMANFYGVSGYDSAVGDLENLSGIYVGQTTLVESYAPNPWGLYDMHGNVSEWCNDSYGDYPIGIVTDPLGPTSGAYRVLRGGSFTYGGGDCRGAHRRYAIPGGRDLNIGFRVVLAPDR